MIGEWLKNHNPFNEPEWEIPDRQEIQEIVDDLKRELYYSELKGVERTKLVYKLCNAYNILSLTEKPKKEGKWVWVEKDES
jgi:hypothetical protein|tara:strand:- start:726 stop:968 length:243 start_codon:yes stop_codon:yes gene_type:complete